MIVKILKKVKRKVYVDTKPFFKMLFYNSICKWWIILFGSHDKRKLKYRVSLCLIFKNEAPFLKEWLDYHLTVGVEHFYLYNNNSDDDFKRVLEPYIKKGTVVLIDWPYNHSQFKAYKHCYENFRNETNWISFLDADEFFVPKYADTIEEWLASFDKYPAVNIHWRMFGTGGQLKHDYSKNVIEQYFTCFDELYSHGKCLINTRYDIASFDLWHVHHHTYMKYPIAGIKMTLPAINQFGYICVVDKTWGGGTHKQDNASMLINHYFTKSWDIYSAKMHRTDVFFKNNPKEDYNYFYKYEMKCRKEDYTIRRFLIRMKINQGLIR
ncbi:glycosyltransferase family 92 protein [Segatella sp.]|uniref:glycosyltransferase family 92 protein n=1 Tax=Segatella sp. TaxID=2974253 RepID=UPI003AAA8FF9